MNPPAQLSVSRLLWVGPLTVLASVAGVLLVRIVAVGLLQPSPSFAPLGWLPPILDTVVLVSGAVVVFLVVGLLARSPIRTYQVIATGVLMLSFWPDIALARAHWFGGGWLEAFALMTMHIVAWAVCVTMPPKLTMTRNP